MYAVKQSDSAIVAVRPANKGARASAESEEPRAGTRGESARTRHGPDTEPGDLWHKKSEPLRQGAFQPRPSYPGEEPYALARTYGSVRGAPGNRRPYRKKEKPGERLTALLHHITPEALGEAYHALKRDAAPGVDGMTWREYEDGLDERLLDLHARVRRGAYRATPVRRVEIPKPGRGRATARYCLAGGQDRPAGGGGADPDPDLRVGVLRIQLRVQAGAFGAQRAGRAGLRGGAAQGQLGSGGGHPPVLRQHRAGAADAVPGDAHRGPAGVASHPEVAERRRHRRGAGGRRGEGDAAGGGDIVAAGERVPAPRAGPLVRAGMAAAGGPGLAGYDALLAASAR